MTVLAEPPSIIANMLHPAPARTGCLLRQRGHPSTDDPDNVVPGIAAAAGSAGRQRPAGSRPLRGRDPVSVDGYRLISRLGSGGMADVFYALAPVGGPVAVKLLRPAGGATEACQREHRLASSVDGRCTAPMLGHGMSTAGVYLVTAYLPGYRCGSTLLGGPTPAARLWSLGAALAELSPRSTPEASCTAM